MAKTFVAEMKRRQQANAAAHNALANIAIGTPVNLTDDAGVVHATKTTSPPWCLGGHTWVINCEGFKAYAIERVSLA